MVKIMEDYLEIDLRQIIKNIFAKWYWVVLPTVLFGISIFLYSYLIMPDFYRAKATIIITDPRNISAFHDISEKYELPKPSATAIQRLALSDDIILQLFDIWDFDEKSKMTLTGFREILDIEASDNATLYTLSVEFSNALAAANLANVWADLVVEKVNSDYFNYDKELVEKYGLQLSAAKLKMDQADAAIIDFIESDPRTLLADRLSSMKAEQAHNFWKQRQLRDAKFDTLGILSQLENEDDDAQVDNSFRINFLLLQARLYSGGSEIMLESPVNNFSQFSLELGNQNLEYMTVGDFRSIIENWIIVIDNQIAQLETEEESYLSTINQLESEQLSLAYQIRILNSDFDSVSQIYNVLLEDYEEIKLSMEITGSAYVKLTSSAAVPDESLPHNTVRNTLIGLVAGGFLGLIGVIIVDWWKSGNVSKELKEEKS